MFNLFKKKVICHYCGKKHKDFIAFAKLPFCSEACIVQFASEIETKELLSLNEKDMEDRQ